MFVEICLDWKTGIEIRGKLYGKKMCDNVLQIKIELKKKALRIN